MNSVTALWILGGLLALGCVHLGTLLVLEIGEYTIRVNECRDLEVCAVTLGRLE